MPAGRDWKDFNDAWRANDLAARLGRWLHRGASVLSWPLRHPHRTVKEIEPWGILFAVVGLFLSLLAFAFDYRDKIEERTVRAWQLVTTKAPGNSGKKEALEYLNKRDGFLCKDDGCLITLKQGTSLTGIDLSSGDWQAGADLSWANFAEADFYKANLSKANLREADFYKANLNGANLREARFIRADLSRADLRKADLSGANLDGANLGAAILGMANFERVSLRGADLRWSDPHDDPAPPIPPGSGVREFRGLSAEQGQLDDACGDKRTKLPEGFTIPMCADVDWYEEAHGEGKQR